MTLDDFVMLGKTVPETNSDGRQFVCTAGYGLELRQAVRVYPMARIGSPSRWSMSRVPLERNHKDSRRESWKIKGNRDPGAHDRINEVITRVQDRVTPDTQRRIVEDMTVASLNEANKQRLSLCVIMPTAVPAVTLEQGDAVEMAPTPDLFGSARELPVSMRFRWHPRLRFADEGGNHDLMLRDWGCYELMRKHGDEAALSLGDALKLAAMPPLLCGNLNRHRNSWLVISVLGASLRQQSGADAQQASLFAA